MAGGDTGFAVLGGPQRAGALAGTATPSHPGFIGGFLSVAGPQMQQQLEIEHQQRIDQLQMAHDRLQLYGIAKDFGINPLSGTQLTDAEKAEYGRRYDAANADYLNLIGTHKSLKQYVPYLRNILHGQNPMHAPAPGAAAPAAGAGPVLRRPAPDVSGLPITRPAAQNPLETPVIPAPPAMAAPAGRGAAPAPVPAIPAPPPRVGGNPYLASVFNAGTPGPSAATTATPTAPAASPQAAAASTGGAATSPALPPPTFDTGAPPSLPAGGISPSSAPYAMRMLQAREAAQAAGLTIEAQMQSRERMINQIMQRAKDRGEPMNYREAAIQVALAEGKMPYTMMRQQLKQMAVPDPDHAGLMKGVLANYDPFQGTATDMNTGMALENAVPFSEYMKTPKTGWGKDAQGYYSFGINPFNNQPMPDTMSRAALPPPSEMPKIKQGHYYYTDPTGAIHDLPSVTVTGPQVPMTAPLGGEPPAAPPAGGGTPAIPAPPAATRAAAAGAAKPAAAGRATGAGPEGWKAGLTPAPAAPRPAPAPAGGRIVGQGKSLGGPEQAAFSKAWTDVEKALTDYNQNNARMRTMDLNQKAAETIGPHGEVNQQAMLSLVANHIGMTLGAQKGARISRAIWDEAMASTPWLKEKISSFFTQDENGDYHWTGTWGPLGGVKLNKSQMDQMVELAHEKRDTAEQTLKDVQGQNADALRLGGFSPDLKYQGRGATVGQGVVPPPPAQTRFPATAPNGQIFYFKDQASADVFTKSAQAAAAAAGKK